MDAEDLEKYSMGMSSDEESELIEEHLLLCEGCQERLRETDEYLLAMRMAAQQRRREEKPAGERGWKFPVWFPALAAACGVLLIVGAARFVQPSGPAVAVSLTAMRGNGAGTGAPSGRILELHPDLTSLQESSTYRLEIVDQTGRPERQVSIGRSQDGAKVPGLKAGLYFVRVYLPSGELLREYGLQIQ